jgi:hypothetical protein
MSDHDSDVENVLPTKPHKPRKTKYVEAAEVETKKVQSNKKNKKRKQEESKNDGSEEEDDAPPQKSSMSDADQEEEQVPKKEEEAPKSLLDDEDDDAMVAAMENQVTKTKQEDNPAKKHRTDKKALKSTSPPPSDVDSDEEERKEAAPSYNAFAKKKAPVKEESDADASDDDDEQRSNKTDSDDDGPVAASSAYGKKFPFESNPVDPNYTVRKWSDKNALHVHFSQLIPSDSFTVTESASEVYAKKFFGVKCNKPQKFDFNAGSDFRQYKFGETVVVGAFAEVKHPRMWPYGDRTPLPHSKFPPPKYNSGIKLKLALFNVGYASNLNHEKKGVGIVDQSADHFMQNWCRLHFAKWAKEQSWKWSQKMFKMRRSELSKPISDRHKAEEAAYNNSKEEWDAYEAYPRALKEYERAMKSWSKVKKNSEPEPEKPEKPEKPRARLMKKPDTTDAKQESELCAAFMREGVNGVVLTGEKDKFEHVNFSAPLLRTLTVAERDGKPEKNIKPLVPNLPNDKFFIDAFRSPPMYTDETKNEKKPGYPLIPVDVPLWRCVTAEEAIHDKKRGFKNTSPHRLISRENRFIVSGDVVAPVFQIDSFDSKTGSGFRFKLLAVIWLGESGRLKVDQTPLAWDPVTKEGFDPATYYCMAQPYKRKKGEFDPETVENSKYESARSNDQQMVEIAPDPESLYG